MNEEYFNSVGGGSSPAFDDWATRLAALRARRRAAPRALAVLLDAAVAVAVVTGREVGVELHLLNCRGLGARRRRDIRQKVGAVRSAEMLLAHVPRGRRDKILSMLAGRLSSAFGRRMGIATLRRWRRAARRHEWALLVDHRGRPRGQRAIDGDLLTEFCGLLGGGRTLKNAHRIVLERGLREARAWPRSIATVRRALRRGTAVVESPRAPQTENYLLKSVEDN